MGCSTLCLVVGILAYYIRLGRLRLSVVELWPSNGVMAGRLLFLQTFSTSGVGVHSGKEDGDLSEMPLAANFKQFDI
jgi:hypothetical protein